MTERTLKRIVKQFREGILDGCRATDFCWMVSAPLDGYLGAIGIECWLVEGEVNGNHHFWLALTDGRIIDATADQFRKPNGSRMSPVFIGPAPPWYIAKAEIPA